VGFDPADLPRKLALVVSSKQLGLAAFSPPAEQLPLLAYYLQTLWKQMTIRGDRFMRADTDISSGLSAWIRDLADEKLYKLPDDRHREVAKRVFQALTERADNSIVRRPILFEELVLVVVRANRESFRLFSTSFESQNRYSCCPRQASRLAPRQLWT
jgi:hypothetical protein